MAGEEFFPRAITRIGKITAKDILLKLAEHKVAIAELQKGAATYGYSIEMSEKNFDKIGFQTIPSSIVIPSLMSTYTSPGNDRSWISSPEIYTILKQPCPGFSPGQKTIRSDLSLTIHGATL